MRTALELRERPAFRLLTPLLDTVGAQSHTLSPTLADSTSVASQRARPFIAGGRRMVKEDLADVLSEFARTMVTNFPIQGILDHLVRRIVDILPITAAGVTLITAGHEPRYVAASDESALRYEKLQTELGRGSMPGGLPHRDWCRRP